MTPAPSRVPQVYAAPGVPVVAYSEAGAAPLGFKPNSLDARFLQDMCSFGRALPFDRILVIAMPDAVQLVQQQHLYILEKR